MRGIGDDEWHFGQTTLIDSRVNRLVLTDSRVNRLVLVDSRVNRLVFQLTGDAVRAALDDIRVIDGECPLDHS